MGDSENNKKILKETEDIKGFQVWRPQPNQPPLDFGEWEPFYVAYPFPSKSPFSNNNNGYWTPTGMNFLFAPWYVVVEKKLSFYLSEWILFVCAFGANVNMFWRFYAELFSSIYGFIPLLYLVFHFHCWAIVAPVYEFRRTPERYRHRLMPRGHSVPVYMGFTTFLFHIPLFWM